MENHESKTGDSGNKTNKNSSEQFFTGKNSVLPSPQPFFQPSLVQRKLSEASDSSSETLDSDTKPELENFLDTDLSSVRVHNNSASHEAADSINAKAYTVGNHIYLSYGANSLPSIQRKALLAHEAVHTIQQQNISPHLQTKMEISQPGDPSENQAESISHDFIHAQTTGEYKSSALAMRSQKRITSVASPVIQRDIKGSQDLANGKMEVDFTKNDATVAGVMAQEKGWVKFHPKDTAPESNEIRLVQIVRTIDIGGASSVKANDPMDWSKVGTGDEADRNKMSTTYSNSKNIAGGFYVDHLASVANPRTKKADAPVSPYYNAYGTGATGKRKGKDKASATLWDGPGFNVPVKFNFVTSAKANDTGTWYGTVLWGFETYLDKGIAKIKGEYKSFRENRGETTDAALEQFNNFYKNPGTAGAPTT